MIFCSEAGNFINNRQRNTYPKMIRKASLPDFFVKGGSLNGRSKINKEISGERRILGQI